MEYFWLNLDKRGIQCNERNIRVVGRKDRQPQFEIMDDSRLSITLLRVENAAGSDGPIIVLLKVKGNDIGSQTLRAIGKHYNCHPGSCLINEPSAYITDQA